MRFKCEYESGKLITFIGVVHISISEYSFIIKDDEDNTYYLKKKNMLSYNVIDFDVNWHTCLP